MPLALGKKGEPLLRIGVDLGGTKISVAVLDASGRLCHAARCATPKGSYSDTLNVIAALVREAEERIGPADSIGIGTPGSIGMDERTIRNANSVCLNGMPLQRDIETLLGRKVNMANDANCFALSEATDGAGRGARIVFGVILGTGVGGGIIVDGRVLEGANRIGGEWGHNPLPLPEESDLPLPSCYCGRSGCIETYLSGPGLAADYRKCSGRDADAKDIVELAQGLEPAAITTLARYCERLSRALAVVINILDPDVIVLGGGLSNIALLYTEVPRLWLPHIFSDSVRTRLLHNVHGDDSGVRGAATLPKALAG
ncbi:MAG: ROK family protein [Burkholderiaceae bacterium]